MPRRNDISKILVLGSGPIVIGQAAEFDYSGAQACKVLLEEGYEVVLINSNPATIMTDPEFATRTYVEPLLPETVRQVIERERPDALLPTWQTTSTRSTTVRPTSGPPSTTSRTPGGRQRARTSARCRPGEADRSDGLCTTVLPVTRAAPISPAAAG